MPMGGVAWVGTTRRPMVGVREGRDLAWGVRAASSRHPPAMPSLRALERSDVDALHELLLQPGVVRDSDHEPDEPRRFAEEWLGDPDPNRALTLGAFEGPQLAAALRFLLVARRRRCHLATVELIVEGSGDARAARVLLEAAVEVADRWAQVRRLEAVAPHGHRLVDGVFRDLGFEMETHRRESLRTADRWVDEVGLARLRPGTAEDRGPLAPPPAFPARGALLPITVRPIAPDDAALWTGGLSELAVVWGSAQLPFQRVDRWVERFSTPNPEVTLLAALDPEGRLIGGASLHTSPRPRRAHLAILGMHVHTRVQGRRVGHQLLTAALDRAREVGFRRMALDVYADHARAVRLYESLGFEHEGRERQNAFRDGGYADGLRMSRAL